MKTNIEHLPAEKQEELQEIVESVRTRLPVHMIILFGSFARGNWVDHRYEENGTTFEYKSDYDILAVLDSETFAIKAESNKKWRHKVRKDTRTETPLNIIFHGIEYLNNEIEDGNYFFIDILKEGIMLYNSGDLQLAVPKKLSTARRQRKAQEYFDKWFKYANSFLIDFKHGFDRKDYPKAIFELHQATEMFLMCMQLVYTDYKPKVHDLEKLDKEATKLDNRFKAVFPRETDEEKRLFTILKKAYIDARYKMDYSVEPQELEYLSGCVTNLAKLTEMACKEKIGSFQTTIK